jgi:hypothetical protein
MGTHEGQSQAELRPASMAPHCMKYNRHCVGHHGPGLSDTRAGVHLQWYHCQKQQELATKTWPAQHAGNGPRAWMVLSRKWGKKVLSNPDIA